MPSDFYYSENISGRGPTAKIPPKEQRDQYARNQWDASKQIAKTEGFKGTSAGDESSGIYWNEKPSSLTDETKSRDITTKQADYAETKSRGKRPFKRGTKKGYKR